MSKYSSPIVTLGDVYGALPRVEMPLSWRVAFYRTLANQRLAFCAIELVYNSGNAATYTYRRWGAAANIDSAPKQMGALLVAAQSAHNEVGGVAPAELLRLVRWQLDRL